jgi:hypothetical protein
LAISRRLRFSARLRAFFFSGSLTAPLSLQHVGVTVW